MEVSPEELQTTDSITVRALKDISFGSTAGIVSKVFEHPFDLTKVRLQSQVLDKQARFSGPLDCLSQTWRKEGLRGLYRVRFSRLVWSSSACLCSGKGRKREGGSDMFTRHVGSSCTHRGCDGGERVPLLVVYGDAARAAAVARDTTHRATHPRTARVRWCWCRSCNQLRSVRPLLHHIHILTN